MDISVLSTYDSITQRLTEAGLIGYVQQATTQEDVDGRGFMRGVMRLELLGQLLIRLKADPRFASGPLHRLHCVGDHPIEYRTHTGEFGRGSLQIVVDQRTGVFESDIDRYSPYSDVVGWIGHSGEVIAGWWRRLW